MLKELKRIAVNLIVGANAAIIVLMIATGYADRAYPPDYPMLAPLGMLFPAFVVLNLLFLLLWLVVKWKKAWIPIAGFALAYVPITIYIPLNMPQDVPKGALKVISYNIEAYTGNGKYDDGFEAIFGYLKEQQADIVCTQEDTDTWRRYVMQRYEEQLYPYNDTTVIFWNQSGNSCVGIHTRFPIVRKERINYESPYNGSVAYYLLVDGDTVLVVNNHLEFTHLSSEDRKRYKTMLKGEMQRDTARAESKLIWEKLGEAAAKRAVAADSVSRYIKAHRGLPTIVCGDFNDTPLSYARRTIADGLTDCYVATGRGLGLSYNQKGFYVRIDNILCSSHFEPFNCKVDKETDASDHYPVVCWLKIRNKP